MQIATWVRSSMTPLSTKIDAFAKTTTMNGKWHLPVKCVSLDHDWLP